MNPVRLLLRMLGAVLVVSGVAARADTYTWRSVVIKGGGFVSGLAFHPTERDLLYARTDVGGAFRWQPNTNSWLPLNDDLGRNDSQLTGVVSIGLDPRDSNRVYLACGQYLPSWGRRGAILRSTDRGLTWSRTELDVRLGGNSDGRSTGERLQVDPNLGAILFLGTNQDGLWKSADHGQTWAKVAGFSPAGVTLVLFDAASGVSGSATPTLYAGVDSTTGASLYRSSDGGATWAAVPGAPTGVLPHHARLAAEGTLYVTYSNALGPNNATSGSVWKKAADGTWTNLSPPAGQGGFAGLSLDPLHPGTLLISTLDRWWPGDEIYRSTDGGATWKAVLSNGTLDTSSAPYSSGMTPHWIGAVEIDPFNAGRAWFVTGFGVFATDNLTGADTNAAVTWHFRNDGLEETVPLDIVSPPTGAPLVSAIGDVDGFRHDDLAVAPARGRHQPSVGTNVSLDFAEAAPERMVRTHSGGDMRGSRSSDGGATWAYFATSPAGATANNEGVIAISADAARIVWAPDNAGLYVSADSGATWTASTGGPAAAANRTYTPVSDRVNATKFYVYNPGSGQAFVSTSGGVSFSVAASGLPTGAEALVAVAGKEGHLWLPAGGNGLYRSTDSAATFSKVTTVQEGYRVGFGKAAPGQSYPAVYLWGRVNGVTGIFRSDDAASTWTRINDDAHQFGWINALTGDPRVYGRVYLATGGRGIVYGDAGRITPTLTWSTPAPIRAGTALTGVELGATTSVPGTFAYDPPLGTVLAAGIHTLTATFTPTDLITYAPTTAQVSLTVLAEGETGNATRLANISTRAYCTSGDRVAIGGFVIAGSAPKRVLIRAVGPSLTAQGIAAADALANPKFELNKAGAGLVTRCDNWVDEANAAAITETAARIGAQPLLANDTKSAAALLTLVPGVYSFVAQGADGGAGIVLLEVYDADAVQGSTVFVDIASRAYCSSGDRVAIGGFVVTGPVPKRVLLRAVGPTLTTAGLNQADVLADPTITLHDASHGNVIVATNDDWAQDSSAASVPATAARIGAAPFAQTDAKSAALLRVLQPGVYSFVASSKTGDSGIVLVEVYDAE